MAHYRPSEFEDCAILAPKMRQKDAQEVWHSCGESPLGALETSFNLSAVGEVNTIIADDGEVIGMFGVVSHPNGVGTPWLLASDRLPEVAREFVPQSKKWVENMLEKHDVLYNYVFAENTISIRWLKWLGFSFIKKEENFGANPAPFYEFAKAKGVKDV